ncbi:MAG: glycosyltransferase [Anaerolineaceae bacterium]|nr:glycosyltransferase [Anaerolineaceae bacterium]
MRELRVALIIDCLDSGGAGKQLALLARGLDRKQFNVTVYALARGGRLADRLRGDGITVNLLQQTYHHDFRVVHRLKELLARNYTDLACTWLLPANTIGRIAALWAHLPIVVATEQDIVLRPGSWHWLDRFLARRSEAIIANSEAVRLFGRKHNWPPDKVRLINPGIEPHETGPGAAAGEPLPEVPPGWRLAVTACRLTREMGLLHLIWALSILRYAEENFHLWIVGQGPEKSRLACEAERLDVASRVHLLGRRDDVPAILSRADLFVLPRRCDGMSIAALEAMAAGVPVVVGDVAGLRELVDNGRCGRLVEPGYPKGIAAGIYQTIAHPGDTRRMVRDGLAWVREQYGAERFVKAHERLFVELAERKGLDS